MNFIPLDFIPGDFFGAAVFFREKTAQENPFPLFRFAVILLTEGWTMKKKICRALLLSLGLFLMGMGNSLLICSNLGSGPYSAMTQGLGNILGIPIGTASSILQALFFLIALLWDRKYLGVGSVLGIVVLGPATNLWIRIFSGLFASAPFLLRLAGTLATPLFVGTGLTIVQYSDMGMVPSDVAPLLIADRVHKLSFKVIHIIWDLILLGLAALMGGVIGFGTVSSALTLGPCMQLARNVLFRLTGRSLDSRQKAKK